MRKYVGEMRRFILVLIMGAMMTACDQGPPPAAVKNELASIVENTLPADLLTLQSVDIAEMRRSGAATDHGQRTIRFVARVRLNRGIDFSTWDQFSIAALADAFGAAPQDIGGVKVHGNSVGDILTIPGTAIYDRDPNISPPWRLHGLGHAATALINPPRVITDLRSLIVMAGTSPEAWKIISANAAWPPSRAFALVARAKGGLAIASGPSGGDAWGVIEALRHDHPAQRPVVNVATATPVENLRLLRDGTVTAAIVDNDTAEMAAAGIGPFAATGAYKDIRALATLYPEPIHVIASAGSGVNSVAELRGKHITVVADGSGSTRIAEDVLRAHRLPNSPPETTVAQTLSEGLEALRAGKTDAVIATDVAPQKDIAAATAANGFRLLGLDSDAIALLTSGETHYLAVSIPGRTYRGQQNAVATVAVAALLVADCNVPAPEVTGLLQRLFGPIDYLHLGSPAGMLINPRTAQVGISIPLHPAAEAEYLVLPP